MNKKERVKVIQKVLNQHFPEPAIPLEHTSPYTLLIAVLLSAQCTDKRVNEVTPALFAKADTPEKMVQLSWQEIQKSIRSCGLSERKAKAIRLLSEILIKKYGSEVPKSIEALIELPGVGHKTASVVMAQAFHTAAFPVDTHIFRLARRWGISRGKNVVQVEADLKRLFLKKDWIKLHLQIIYFARTYCQAKGHIPKNCPICSIFEL